MTSVAPTPTVLYESNGETILIEKGSRYLVRDGFYLDNDLSQARTENSLCYATTDNPSGAIVEIIAFDGKYRSDHQLAYQYKPNVKVRIVEGPHRSQAGWVWMGNLLPLLDEAQAIESVKQAMMEATT
jgi:hypothetical protein